MNRDDGMFALIQSVIIDRENKEARDAYEETRVEDDKMKWSKTGLLEAIDDSTDRKILSMLFQEAFDMLMVGEITMGENFETFIFPIIRRLYIKNILISIYGDRSSLIRIRKRIRIFLRALGIDVNKYIYSPHTKKMIEEYKSHPNIDIEAEVIYQYCTSFKLDDLKDEMKRAKKYYRAKEKLLKLLLIKKTS